MRKLGISLADIRLWRDDVVSEHELIKKRLSELDEWDKSNDTQRQLCETAMHASSLLDLPDSFSAGKFCDMEDDAHTEPSAEEKLAFGVDIGTTTISAQLISLADGRPIHTYSITHSAAMEIPGQPDAYAANAADLIKRVISLVKSVSHLYSGLAVVGFTGQMHGIVCMDENADICSPLYTWQNEFGLRKQGEKSYCAVLRDKTGIAVPSGYGLVTYFCLEALHLLSPKTAVIATIMDAAIQKLCRLPAPVTHTSNAASLGFFDLENGSFCTHALHQANIPEEILPHVKSGFQLAGSFSMDGRSIPVAVALGDNQASLFGSLVNDNQVLVNIGTSSQVSVLIPEMQKVPACAELRPYCDSRMLLTGCALCGGRAYSALADFFCEFLQGIGSRGIAKNAVYQYLNTQCMESSQSSLRMDTRFCGTRADPSIRGGISGLTLESFHPAEFARATLTGIADELLEMYRSISPDIHRTPVFSGNAVRRNPAFRQILGSVFGAVPLVPVHTEEAAYGAALYAAISAGLMTSEAASGFIHYSNE